MMLDDLFDVIEAQGIKGDARGRALLDVLPLYHNLQQNHTPEKVLSICSIYIEGQREYYQK